MNFKHSSSAHIHVTGGVWVYHEDKPGGCYQKTCKASKGYLHTSDYPMPNNVGHFPNCHEVLKFLNDYADKFDLWRHIHQCHHAQGGVVPNYDANLLRNSPLGAQDKGRNKVEMLLCVMTLVMVGVIFPI